MGALFIPVWIDLDPSRRCHTVLRSSNPVRVLELDRVQSYRNMDHSHPTLTVANAWDMVISGVCDCLGMGGLRVSAL